MPPKQAVRHPDYAQFPTHFDVQYVCQLAGTDLSIILKNNSIFRTHVCAMCIRIGARICDSKPHKEYRNGHQLRMRDMDCAKGESTRKFTDILSVLLLPGDFPIFKKARSTRELPNGRPMWHKELQVVVLTHLWKNLSDPAYRSILESECLHEPGKENATLHAAFEDAKLHLESLGVQTHEVETMTDLCKAVMELKTASSVIPGAAKRPRCDNELFGSFLPPPTHQNLTAHGYSDTSSASHTAHKGDADEGVQRVIQLNGMSADVADTLAKTWGWTRLASDNLATAHGTRAGRVLQGAIGHTANTITSIRMVAYTTEEWATNTFDVDNGAIIFKFPPDTPIPPGYSLLKNAGSNKNNGTHIRTYLSITPTDHFFIGLYSVGHVCEEPSKHPLAQGAKRVTGVWLQKA